LRLNPKRSLGLFGSTPIRPIDAHRPIGTCAGSRDQAEPSSRPALPRGFIRIEMERLMSEESKVQSAASDLTADLAALRNDIAKISASLMELVQEKAKSGVFNAVDGARQKLSDTAADAHEKVGNLGDDVEATIERNPLVAVLLAALAGFIVGMMSRPRK
jgi:ElaB/YqjD/DUF883 family membrane-anchored ribosome-binding protein